MSDEGRLAMKDSAGGRALPPSDVAFPCEPLTPAEELTEATEAEDRRAVYDKAVRYWAVSIAENNGLQGICMGRVFAIADVLGIGADQIVGDLRTAQAELETA